MTSDMRNAPAPVFPFLYDTRNSLWPFPVLRETSVRLLPPGRSPFFPARVEFEGLFLPHDCLSMRVASVTFSISTRPLRNNIRIRMRRKKAPGHRRSRVLAFLSLIMRFTFRCLVNQGNKKTTARRPAAIYSACGLNASKTGGR